MSTVSKELVEQIKYFLPNSKVRYLIRSSKPKIVDDKTPEGIIAQIPQKIAELHAIHRREYADVTYLTEGATIGFNFPTWRASKFAKEIRPEWLTGDAKKIYDYCQSNDLRPGFDLLARYRGDQPGARLMIRWQAAHFNRLLGLDKNPLFQRDRKIPVPTTPSVTAVDIAELAARADRVNAERKADETKWKSEFEIEMDEESDAAAEAYIGEAIKAMSAAADKGWNQATIFKSVGSLGTNLIGQEKSVAPNHFSDYRLFDNPKWDAAVARGLCRWAASRGWELDIQVSDWGYRGRDYLGLHLEIVVPFKKKSEPAEAPSTTAGAPAPTAKDA